MKGAVYADVNHVPSESQDISQCIRESKKEYIFLRNLAMWASHRRHAELAAHFFAASADFARRFHSGFFVDAVVESELLKIGQAIDEDQYHDELPEILHATGKRYVLHVFSEVNTVGGHCRTLIHWIRNDPATAHVLVILRQLDREALDWIKEQLEPNGVQVIALDPDSTLLRRAIQIRRISRLGFNAVVNHVGQAEVIPSIAFAVKDCPPVLLVDHADHSFWVGIGMTDIVVHQRPIGGQICSKRRGSRSSFVLPIPIEVSPAPPVSSGEHSIKSRALREQVRSHFDIGEHQIMGLTVGRRDKYRPLNKQNFFRSAFEFMRDHPNFVLHVVGVEKVQAEQWAGANSMGENFVFHGEVPVDPRLRQVADLYLESYPFGSQTAFLEAAQASLASVRAPVDTALLATSDSAIDSCLPVPADEMEYWYQVSDLLGNPIRRQQCAERLKTQVEEIHTGEGWVEQLEALYERVAATRHAPNTSSVIVDSHIDHHDVALHLWHRWQGENWANDHELRLHAKSTINNAMRRQLFNGDRRLLFSLAVRSLLAGRGDRTIVRMGFLQH